MKKIIFWVILFIIPIFLFIISVELYYVTFRSEYALYRYEKELGWVTKKNHILKKTHSDIKGQRYDVSIDTNKYGFRSWGDIDTNKDKLLFIGDSFTDDENVSDADMYFTHVGKLIDAEVFAAGGGGYGTLQELIILRRYIEKINPDYFILQYCTNDIANNSYALEGKSITRNQSNLRPYLVGEDIIYRLPPHHWYKVLYTHSALFRFVDNKLQAAQYRYHKGYSPPSKDDKATRNREFADAVQTTEKLLKMMADTVGDEAGLITFSCKTENPKDTNMWVRISASAGFTPLPNVSGSLEDAEKEGVIVRQADGGHWNPKGHEIVGKALAVELKKIIAQNPE